MRRNTQAVVEIKFMPRMRETDLKTTRQFALPHSKQRLVFIPSALEAFSNCRQMRGEPEGGGLLFAQFEFPTIRILVVTRPHRTDGRWMTLFVPNRILQRRTIKNKFKKGYHFIGEWHTHPEQNPTPSGLDLKSMREAFLKSNHELNYFIMVIVGNVPDSLVLWVSAHDDSHFERLDEHQ
jgi:integrative and conjugative element protein (TIGR02256 family)